MNRSVKDGLNEKGIACHTTRPVRNVISLRCFRPILTRTSVVHNYVFDMAVDEDGQRIVDKMDNGWLCRRRSCQRTPTSKQHHQQEQNAANASPDALPRNVDIADSARRNHH